MSIPQRAPGEGAIPLNVAEEAMQWLLELQEPQVSEQTRARWMLWRQADPLHEKAWQRAQAFSMRMSALRSPGQKALASATLSPMLSRRSTLKSLAVLLAAGGVAWGAKDTALVQDWSSDFSSAVGERRTLQLAEHVTVQLNTDSAIDVHFDPQTRLIRLRRGEIIVDVASGDERPLWVQTAEGRIQALGTRFAIRQRNGFTQASAVQGGLGVFPLAPSTALAPLPHGEIISFDRQRQLARRAQDAGELAWSQGMIVARGQRLADFLADLARYRPGHLGCDPRIAELRISGTFPLDDTDKVLAALGETFALDVHRITRYWVTLKPKNAYS